MPGRVSRAKYELIFIAKSLPAVGYRSYYVGTTKTNKGITETVQEMGPWYTIGHKVGLSLI